MTAKFITPILFAFLGHAAACERPQLSQHLTLNEVGERDFRMDWKPIAGAAYYELKYILRAPEGRTVAQREVMLDVPVFHLTRDQFANMPFVHLVAELVAYCDGKKSEPAFAQVSLKNTDSRCRFDAQRPVLNNGEVAWPPVKAAQSYLVCFFKEAAPVACHETVDVQNKMALERSMLVSVTPICSQTSGIPFFIPLTAR